MRPSATRRAAASPARRCSFELALEDLRRPPICSGRSTTATGGVDGWVSMEVSPLLADDTAGTIEAAARLHARAQRPNLYVKIPGTAAGLPAIEEAIFAGVPVNVTLLFSREHYLAAAEAYMRGIERRIAAGLDPKSLPWHRCSSAAGTWPSTDKVPAGLRNRLGIAIAMRTYRAYRDLLASARWQKLAAAGARPQRLLWASTGTKDPQPRPPVRRGARRPGDHQHHAREDAARVRRARQRGQRIAGRRRRCRSGAAEFAARASTMKRWPPNCSATARSLRQVVDRTDVPHRRKAEALTR